MNKKEIAKLYKYHYDLKMKFANKKSYYKNIKYDLILWNKYNILHLRHKQAIDRIARYLNEKS